MERVEVRCANCGKEIYVYESYLRERMFCTIACLNAQSGNSTKAEVLHKF